MIIKYIKTATILYLYKNNLYKEEIMKQLYKTGQTIYIKRNLNEFMMKQLLGKKFKLLDENENEYKIRFASNDYWIIDEWISHKVYIKGE
jgi:hypothetical protein